MAEIRWININMGCIETHMDIHYCMPFIPININMGCIETEVNENNDETRSDKH